MDNLPNQPNQPKPIRLNKFLAERLGTSRREADELIAGGKITVGGKTATLGARVNTSAGPAQEPVVRYNGKVIPFETDFLYVAMNKPIGYVCSRRAQGDAPTIYELLPQKYHALKTVGRLDKDSSGLILLTNDGDFAFQMTHPKFRKNKVYEVELDRLLAPLHQQMISDYGVMLDDGPSKFKIIKNEAGVADNVFFRERFRFGRPETYIPDGAEKAARRADFPGRPAYDVEGGQVAPEKDMSDGTPASYMVILSEGRNRQIRRTFAALGYRVTKLHRITFGKYELSELKPGECVIIKP